MPNSVYFGPSLRAKVEPQGGGKMTAQGSALGNTLFAKALKGRHKILMKKDMIEITPLQGLVIFTTSSQGDTPFALGCRMTDLWSLDTSKRL